LLFRRPGKKKVGIWHGCYRELLARINKHKNYTEGPYPPPPHHMCNTAYRFQHPREWPRVNATVRLRQGTVGAGAHGCGLRAGGTYGRGAGGRRDGRANVAGALETPFDALRCRLRWGSRRGRWNAAR